jgi:pimeloyl-ACP methyl ester carboxylesterase
MGIPLAGMDPVLHGIWRIAGISRISGISRVLIAVQLATLRLAAQYHSDLLLQSLYLTAPRCDRDIVARPEVREMFSRTFRTASAPGVAGLIDELTLLAKPWTVDLNDIQGATVEFIYGDKDRLTPPVIGVRLSRLLPGSRLTVIGVPLRNAAPSDK